MRVAIIGTGNVGSALAQGLTGAGHDVTFGVREPSSFSHPLTEQGVGVDVVPAAAEAAEVIIISVPADATPAVAKNIKDSVTDQIIIDTTNVVTKGPEGYQDGFSALKEIIGSEHIIKCFNSTGAENMENPAYPDTTLDMFIAGGSERKRSGNIASKGYWIC